jgi:hypothetical protein
MAGQQAGTNLTGIRGGAVTLAEAADAFLSSPRTGSPNTRRAYAGVLDRLAAELGPGRRSRRRARRRDRRRAAPPVGRMRAGDVEPQPGRDRVLADLVRRQERPRYGLNGLCACGSRENLAGLAP